jgi:hypothetical protein
MTRHLQESSILQPRKKKKPFKDNQGTLAFIIEGALEVGRTSRRWAICLIQKALDVAWDMWEQ